MQTPTKRADRGLLRLLPEAEAHLAAIYDYIRDHTSRGIAQGYVQRIMNYLAGFDTFPERGMRRDDIRRGCASTRRVDAPSHFFQAAPTVIFAQGHGIWFICHSGT